MTDEEFMRRLNREFDVETIKAKAVYWSIVGIGVVAAVTYYFTGFGK